MTGSTPGRARELLRNGRVAATTVAQHITDDPVVFSLQLSRRLPDRLVRPMARALARLPGRAFPAARATGLHILGEDAAARRVLRPALTGGPRATLRRCGEVALTMGELDLVDTALAALLPGARGSAALAARRAWHAGEPEIAIAFLRARVRENTATAGERALLGRLGSERELLDGFVPVLRPVPGYRPAPETVLHAVTNSLPHTASGYAQRTHCLLGAVRDEGWTVHALTRPGYPVQVGKLLARGTDVVDGISYHRTLPARLAPTATGRIQQQAEALLELALRVRPAVLHTTTHYVNALAVAAVARALGIPWVYEVRGLLADTWAATHGPGALTSERYRRFQEREAQAILAADDVVTLGETMAGRVREIAHAPALPIRLVPNAVDAAFAREPGRKDEAREKTGLPGGRFLVGSVTSMVDYEGLDDLLRAVALLRSEIPSVLAVIVGDGVARPGLERLARELGLTDHVRFTGRVARSEALEYFLALDAFVLPRKDRSVTRTVTPLKPVEAMACATPVVASDLPALRETVRHGQTGLLTRPDDPESLAAALSVLAADPDLAERLAREGRRWVLEHRTWAAAAKATVARYRDLLAEPLAVPSARISIREEPSEDQD